MGRHLSTGFRYTLPGRLRTQDSWRLCESLDTVCEPIRFCLFIVCLFCLFRLRHVLSWFGCIPLCVPLHMVWCPTSWCCRLRLLGGQTVGSSGVGIAQGSRCCLVPIPRRLASPGNGQTLLELRHVEPRARKSKNHIPQDQTRRSRPSETGKVINQRPTEGMMQSCRCAYHKCST